MIGIAAVLIAARAASIRMAQLQSQSMQQQYGPQQLTAVDPEPMPEAVSVKPTRLLTD